MPSEMFERGQQDAHAGARHENYYHYYYDYKLGFEAAQRQLRRRRRRLAVRRAGRLLLGILPLLLLGSATAWFWYHASRASAPVPLAAQPSSPARDPRVAPHVVRAVSNTRTHRSTCVSAAIGPDAAGQWICRDHGNRRGPLTCAPGAGDAAAHRGAGGGGDRGEGAGRPGAGEWAAVVADRGSREERVVCGPVFAAGVAAVSAGGSTVRSHCGRGARVWGTRSVLPGVEVG